MGRLRWLLQSGFNEVDCFCWILSNSKLLSATNRRGRGQAHPPSGCQSKQFLAPLEGTALATLLCWRFPWICQQRWSCIGLSAKGLVPAGIQKRCQIAVKAVLSKALRHLIELVKDWELEKSSPIFLLSLSCSSAEKSNLSWRAKKKPKLQNFRKKG